MGQCRLFSSVTVRQEDQSWKSGVRRQAFDGTLVESRALPEPGQGPANAFPGSPSWRKLGFDVYEGLSVGGQVIKESQVDSVAGCLNVCKNTASCVASVVSGSGRALRCAALSGFTIPETKSGYTAIIRKTP